MATTFRYLCYRELLGNLGRFDAICGYATIAVDFLNEELEQNSDPRDWLSRYAKGHGVILHDVDTELLRPRMAEMFVLLVHAHLEEFLRSFLHEHEASKKWPKREDKGLFEYVLVNLKLIHACEGEAERETIEYYHLARNHIVHPDIKTTRLENQHTKLRKLLQTSGVHEPPRPYYGLDFGDFFLFTRAVKAYAAVICSAARPTDSEIAASIGTDIKRLNRVRCTPKRFRNAVRQVLQMRYQLNIEEAERIVSLVVGG